jgi:hypothetical protein
MISAEPRNGTYDTIIELAVRKRMIALLIVRRPERISKAALAVLDTLGPFVLNQRIASEWPGTVLHGGTAVVREIELNEAAAAVLTSAAQGLYAWIHPDLPEDLCMLRPDRTPWLVSIAHEKDGYFELDAHELAELEAEVPEVQVSLREDDIAPE